MKKIILTAVAAAALSAGCAHASIIPVLANITNDGDGTYTFSYTGTLAADQGVTKGSELVIFDFAGYVPGSIQVPTPDISASIQDSSSLALPPGMVDNPNIPNLVFTWEGPDFNTVGAASADIPFSGLSAKSTLSGEQMGAFSALAVKNSGAQAGTLTLNQGYVSVPAGVPEPMSWSLMILGFGGLGATLRANRRRTALA
ncbi:MAG: PEPxxWA-CTERM sorting domain-containing protein [Proteobacteria bacterium]|nr:PEPxxWA-CTERM sorting domain-containing protein [Pseudomonadota bacterium]